MMIAGKKTGSAHAGFTLLEALLAVSLCTALLVALMASFIQGVKIFRRATRLSAEEKISFFFERVTKDLTNFSTDLARPAVWAKDSASFTTLIPVAAAEGGGPEFMPHAVSYRFDPEKRAVLRTIQKIFPGKEPAKTETAAADVVACSFDTLEGGREGTVKRVTVHLECDTSSGRLNFKKHVWIPVSYASSR